MEYKFLLIIVSLILTFYKSSIGQKITSTNFYEEVKNYDLSQVFNPDSVTDDMNKKYKQEEPLGYIDTTYQRFQIHFTSIEKSKSNPYVYNIIGKTKVKENICSFNGTITVISSFNVFRFLVKSGAITYCYITLYSVKLSE